MDILQCKVPLCTNHQDLVNEWPICTDCMVNSVKRFKHYLPNKSDTEIQSYIVAYIDKLVAIEQETINRRGANYDRDKLDEEIN